MHLLVPYLGPCSPPNPLLLNLVSCHQTDRAQSEPCSCQPQPSPQPSPQLLLQPSLQRTYQLRPWPQRTYQLQPPLRS